MSLFSQNFQDDKLRRDIRLLQNQYVLLLQEVKELRKYSTSNFILDEKEREKDRIKLLVENKLHELRLLEQKSNHRRTNVSAEELNRERGTKNENSFLFFLFVFLAVISIRNAK